MEKTFSKIEISVIKSTAKNASQFVAKKQKVAAMIKEVEEKVAEQIRKRAAEKIEKLEAEMAGYQSIIDSLNAPVKQITGGYTTEDLVDIKKEGTGSMDPKTGKEIMKTVYVLKYPDTVVPPTNDTTDCEPATNTESMEGGLPTDSQEPLPEEAVVEQAQVAQEAADADPFAYNDPFNQ